MGSWTRHQWRRAAERGPMSGERPLLDLHFTREKYTAGEVILDEGAVVEAYFLVELGSVSISQGGDYLVTKGKGAHFEHLWTRATVTVVAQKFTEVVKVDRVQFEEHVRPTFFDGEEQVRHEDVSDLLTELMLEARHSNPTVRSALPFVGQLAITFIIAIGATVLAVNLALDSGWKPWQTCNRCDRNAPEPSIWLHLFYAFSLALVVGAASVGKRYLRHL